MSKRILVVEDQEYLRDLLRDLRLYSHRGRRWRGAKARSEHPDLILMDVIMPGTNGYEATRAITRDERTKSIPVIICTGKDGSTDRLWGLRQGAKDYVTKPIDHHALIEKIAALS